MISAVRTVIVGAALRGPLLHAKSKSRSSAREPFSEKGFIPFRVGNSKTRKSEAAADGVCLWQSAHSASFHGS